MSEKTKSKAKTKTKTKAKTRVKKKIASWATKPFKNCLADLERLGQVVHISKHGIATLQSAPGLIEALMDLDEEKSEEATARLESAKVEAEFSAREVEEDFPVLHAWAVVGLWAHLEALIREFLAVWLAHRSDAWQCEEVSKLRVRLGEYHEVPEDQRNYYVVSLLESNLASGIRKGVNRFESMLDPFELSGSVPKAISELLYDLGQARNVISHNASKVDQSFVNSCPWVDASVGSNLHISTKMFDLYMRGSMAYLTLLICRIGDKFGKDMSDNLTSIEALSEELEEEYKEQKMPDAKEPRC